MNRIIIDADPGVDDAFAISLACKNEFIDLEAITVVAGNSGLKNGIRNSFKILDMCDKYYIPVYKGAEVSLENRSIDAENVHGENGFGNLEYDSIVRSTSGDAIEYLINMVNSNPGEISIVAVGPLTNIALAIMRDKNFAKNLKGLFIMGSSKVEGNITKYAEFNFYQDPHAAKLVLDSEIENIYLFGLNVTTRIPLLEKYEEILKNSDNKLANMLYDISRMGAEFDRSVGHAGFILNDPLPIAYLINSNVVELMNADVDILTEGELIGRSKITLNENGKCKVAYSVDSELFYEILFDSIIKKKF